METAPLKSAARRAGFFLLMIDNDPAYDNAYRILESSREIEWDNRCVYCNSAEEISVVVGVLLGEVSKMAVCTRCQ